ncbi:hypothetical protein MG290_06305 [Flavobacterium sp. CBA20B-1]|uniref:hypothetical protein n=1 Tax=unclassified Flavobacterium TaxID=196869 RepID=UPI002225A2DD|nr:MULTISPECIES: hypothetical protein [unclassified Flavobacterium]WCM43267.1 hypothetical protein MG290_06305 [Flavobacterium sp. CBA20B-1]
MMTYLKHRAALLHIESQMVECSIQKYTWMEIHDKDAQKVYQEQINEWAFKKENYLNRLLVSLTKTEITTHNIMEIKKCYELVEAYSKNHYSQLFKTHLNRTIENHQKKYGDFLLTNQLKKAVEVEQIIMNLERIA